MPLYPYRCTQCGYHFEKIQRFSDEPVTKCPKCGGALERPLTAPGLKFVGSGWYANDYGHHAAGAASDSSAKKAEPETAGAAGDKTEKKAEPKAVGDKSSSPATAAQAAAAGSTS